ncbi:MAG: dynamin family protein [Lachnospiraceae bacterium]|nr:dynamin family protein [Lachnospiraceae bacterium]
MTLQNRITVSAADTMQRLEQNLDKLRRFQYDGQYRRLLGDTLTKHLELWDNHIRSRRKDPFTIVVVGEFKRGKSSFINALLGEEILVTDVVPETVTMNKLSYGMHKNEAVLSGGRRLTLKDEELSRPALERLMEELGEPIRQLELWRPNERLKDVRIIDTPGLNDVTDEYLDSIVADAMAQADAVIYVYSVNSPLARSEQMYIRYAILPQQYTKLFLVGNYSDLLHNTEDLEHIRSLMGERTELLMPGERTYLISALDEMCRVLERERPCPELASILERDFEELRQAIMDLIQEKKTTVVADRMQRMTRQMIEDINADLSNIEKGLEMTASQLDEERKKLQNEEGRYSQQLDQAKAKILESVDKMKADAAGWTTDLLNRMEREDLSSYSVQEIGQYYAYYCVELLETELRACLEMHREELLEQMGDISDELGKDLAGMYATGDNVQFCFRVNNNTWTRGDSVTMAISMASGGSVFSTLADLVGSFTRKSELESEKDKLVADIKGKYPAFKKEVLQKSESQYSALARSACGLIEEYYQGQLQRAKETVAQYEEVSQKCDEDKRQVMQIVGELRQVLEAFDKDGIY